MQAITSRHQNNSSSQGKAKEDVGEVQNFSLFWCWRAEDCWSLWFVGTGGAVLKLLQSWFCGMLCLLLTSGAWIWPAWNSTWAAWLLSGALWSFVPIPSPIESRGSLPIYFTGLRREALFGDATLSRFRDFTLSKVIPKLFLRLCFYKKIPTVSNNGEKALHVSSAPIWRAAAHSPARSGPRKGPLNRVTSPGCQRGSPRQGFQRYSKAFKTAEAYVSITACSQN